MLHIKNLSKKFGNHTVLHDISCDVPQASIGVFLGQSGTGKSTLLRIIAGLEAADKGTILYNGTLLQTEKVGMVFQHFNLFENLTVRENITFALIKGRTQMAHDQAYRVADELLAHYELSEVAHHFPDELSGGQKQRVAIVRTIAQKPALICFDEPTSALDPLLKSSVARTLKDLALQGYMVIVATHDMHLVEQLAGDARCRIFLMKAGAIVETAELEDVMHAKKESSEIKKFMYYR